MRAVLASIVLVAACAGEASPPPRPILLFTGTGTSAGDVAAMRALLDRAHLAYDTASSAELDAMTPARLGAHRLLIVPGGDFVAMGDALDARTMRNVHEAVAQGLGYLGICAGAFLAGYLPPPYHALDLTGGVQFHFYSAEDRGVRRAALPITHPDGRASDHYWEDGPQLSGWGEVALRYPDATPALVQGPLGSGWVVLSGIHPEAPESWREGLSFGSSAEEDEAEALTIVRAALERTRLPSF